MSDKVNTTVSDVLLKVVLLTNTMQDILEQLVDVVKELQAHDVNPDAHGERFAALGDIAHLDGDETVRGVKRFAESPHVPTPGLGDCSSRAASTEYVSRRIEKIELTPGPPGEPGQKGDPGEPGQKGDPGEPGADGSIVGAIESAELSFVIEDGDLVLNYEKDPEV